MNAWLDCVPCCIRQGLNTIRHISDDGDQHREVVHRIVTRLVGVTLEQTPAALSDVAYRVVEEVTGNPDPYLEEKRQSNAEALAIYDELARHVTTSDDPLKTALKLAIMGNLIDKGIGHGLDPEVDIEAALVRAFAHDDYAELKRELAEARTVVYLGDNAGEIVFDKLVVEQLQGKDVTFVVKSRPIINDAMMADALQVGMDEVARVIENGSGRIGTDLDDISDELRTLLDGADVVISKGQGNFETLADAPFERYFLLTAKCDCVAHVLGVSFRDAVLMKRVATD